MPEQHFKTVNIPEECWEAVRHVAADEKTSIQQVVEDALRAYKPMKAYLKPVVRSKEGA